MIDRWTGRHGSVLLGPTEARVARFLHELTRHGRVTLRSADLVVRLRIERSEFYRITRRLRTLGLFGIEDDRGGIRGGRRYWRTATRHDGAGLDPRRRRLAQARIAAWAQHARTRVVAALTSTPATASPAVREAGPRSPQGSGLSFSAMMARYAEGFAAELVALRIEGHAGATDI